MTHEDLKMLDRKLTTSELYGECKVLADSESVVSPADTSAEETAEPEPNVTNENERDVLGIDAPIACAKCPDKIKDDKATRRLCINTPKPRSDAAGDSEVE